MPNYFQKGIILAGGAGSRLYPLTRVVSKQLLPVYDKPMIYYPLSVLMLAGIRRFLLITTPDDAASYSKLLGNGNHMGIAIDYAIQSEPRGLAQAFTIGREFIGQDNVALILGGNIFCGTGLKDKLSLACQRKSGATCFAYHVKDPSRFGIVQLDSPALPVSLEEKPEEPKSDLAVTGLYFYDNQIVDIAADLTPSARGELEITDANRVYLRQNRLFVERLGRGFAWLDTGTPESLLQASAFIETIESRQGLKIACVEEIALRNGFVSKEEFASLVEQSRGDYRRYLKALLDGDHTT